jgi:dTDP-4-amino-4,6-dideoxygalactose transaminase
VKSTIYWPFHGEIDLASFPGAAWIFEHIFSVPVDQRYSREDMEYLAEVLKETAVLN